MKTRWCSAYLKIDVCSAAIRNQERFNNNKTLLISGERAEESPSRAKYSEFEPDRSDGRIGRNKRLVDRWRPIYKWKEPTVWQLLEKYRINPHPAYRLGWGRLSCRACIFGSPNQWASLYEIDKAGVDRLETHEKNFGYTITKGETVTEKAKRGCPYKETKNTTIVEEAMSIKWQGNALIKPDQTWQLPAGAGREANGPT